MTQCIQCKRSVVDEQGDCFDSNFCWWHTASSPKPTIIVMSLFVFLWIGIAVF